MPSTANDITAGLKTIGLAENTKISHYLAAIDFGSTFTAAAYFRLDQQTPQDGGPLDISLEDIVKVDRYPGPFNSKAIHEEVPTISRYLDKHLEKWGFQVSDRELPGTTTHVELAKLLLDITKKSEQIRERLTAQLEFLEISHIQLISDYLQKLGRHINDQIDSKDESEEKNIQYVLTFPPLFGVVAQQDMKKAASEAGLTLKGGQCIISEPEAAAAFFLAKNKNTKAKVGLLT